VFDALAESRGSMYAVSGAAARKAGALFESREGIDLDPAADVALAGLIQAVARGNITSGQVVLYNATGGGAKRLAAEDRSRSVEPDYIFTPDEAKSPGIIEKKLRTTGARRPS